MSESENSKMHRCWGRNRNFLVRCSRLQTNRFCDEHRKQPLYFILIIIFLPIGLNLISSTIHEEISHIRTPEIICDRNNNSGCSIDFKLPPLESMSFLGTATYNNQGIEDSLSGIIAKLDYVPIAIKSGGVLKVYIVPLKIQNYLQDTLSQKVMNDLVDRLEEPITFPQYLNIQDTLSPYKIIASDNKLLFSGLVKDYKTNEILGWFDENEFGVVERCSFSWNKDDRGIEIIDKYGNVCFSLDITRNEINTILIFKGFFKAGNRYYIFNNSQYTTDSIEVAEKLIKDIKPIFDHFGSDSYGKRI